jgi:cytochrome o ubiquinol oxidase subunit I
MMDLIFGKLGIKDIPYHNPIIMGAGVMMALIALFVVGYITWKKQWGYIFKEWVATIDHKKIGIMYIILAAVMLLRGFVDAMLMRIWQSHLGILPGHFFPPDHYAEVFSAHGVIMIFFVAMPMLFGLFNIAVPLQIGARDVAYPYLNSLSFWLTFVGAMLVNISLIVGKFASYGWLSYAPYSGIHFSPGVGIDYYIWALQISGVGSLLSGVNFIATIMKMRCPGMTLMKMPIFTWSSLCASILVALAFPILTVTLALLCFDRTLGTHFFTQMQGGNVMMYPNLIWAWGHPEVYILILPAFGVFSEVVSVFSKKKLFGYVTMVWAIIVITFLSFVVWLHHFFTMGSGGDVNAFFGITTMIIAIPTGVKIFNWLFTMYRGRVEMNACMHWVMGFFITFAIGGMTGVLMAIPAVDFQTHNSTFLIAHFHQVIIGGVLFGFFAGLTYWFPKVFGFRLNEFLGKCSFYCWIIGFYLAFMPLYVAGLNGFMRRTYHYADPAFKAYFVCALIGACIIGLGVLLMIIQVVYSYIHREKYRDNTGDPWGGRTLEWSISSPAPFYNFAHIPEVSKIDDYWYKKQAQIDKGQPLPETHYSDVHMPRNSYYGFLIAMSLGLFGFAMTWHMLIPGIIGLAGVGVLMALKTFNLDVDYYVPAKEVHDIELAHFKEAHS